jgi:hypothetical protein
LLDFLETGKDRIEFLKKNVLKRIKGKLAAKHKDALMKIG